MGSGVNRHTPPNEGGDAAVPAGETLATGGGLSEQALLNAIPLPVLLIAADDQILAANPAAEFFFATSAAALRRESVASLIAPDCPLVGLVQQVRDGLSPFSEYGLHLATARTQSRTVDVHLAPVVEMPGAVLALIQERSIAERMDRQLVHRGAARSVTAMAAVLAHEVKNPLSGIRGAAQLLEQSIDETDRPLTRLICDETDRICGIVDRMDVFSDSGPPRHVPVNIHEVLDHVCRLAENGVAKDVRIAKIYDPSLPPVLGERDRLIQVFLNLIKNAAEAVPRPGGEVQISTSFRPGVRISLPGSRQRLTLPLQVAIHDNGSGVPAEIAAHMFDPFVTAKPSGTGLGLALVAKIVGDHGGIVEHEQEMESRTTFRVLLPMVADADAAAEDG